MRRSSREGLRCFFLLGIAGLAWMWLASVSLAQQAPQDNKSSTVAKLATEAMEDREFAAVHEDLGTPSLATSALILKKIEPGPKIETPELTRETIRLQWRAHDPVDLYIAFPKGAKRAPVIVYLYGYPQSNRRLTDEGWYQRTTAGGYATVAFVMAVSDARFHAPRPLNQNFLTQMPDALAMTAHDVQMVLNYLQTRNDLDLDLDRIGVFATGSGASAAILAAAVDSRIKAIDLLNPWGDWPDWSAKSELIGPFPCDACNTPDYLKNLAPLDPVKWLGKLKTPNVRFRLFPDNGETPKEAQERIEAAIPKTAQVEKFRNVAIFSQGARGGATFSWIKSVFPIVDPSAENAAKREAERALAAPAP